MHKKGIRNHVQKWYCKQCCKYQQKIYVYSRVTKEKEIAVLAHNKESNSVSSIARLIKLSKTTVQRILRRKNHELEKPQFHETDQEYEMDELRTYVGDKQNPVWIIYAINKTTRKVIDLIVGKRTKENILKVVETVLNLNPLRIHTDKLNIYPTLIPYLIHRNKKYKTNHIERYNLNLRNCLKRLSRKTICFSKSEKMLEACVRLCVWS